MSTTMSDIAERVGVAKSTVSLALNDKPGVSDELRAQILEAAKQMGYRLPPRRNSRSEPTTFAVINHVVLESEAEISGVALGYLKGIQQFAREHNINLTILTDYRGGADHYGYQFLNQSNLVPDGLILMGGAVTLKSSIIRWAQEKEIPMVVLSRNWPDSHISTVSQDHVEQAQMALDHLIDLGHRKIGFVARKADHDCDWFALRLRCYKETLDRHTGFVDESLIAIADDGYRATIELFERRPDVTAIFCMYDRIAIEAMQGLKELGIRVPEDVSVIGLDDADKPPQGFPSLTTVGFSHIDMGYLGADLLFRKIENPHIQSGQICLSSYLIQRDSCRELIKEAARAS
ncbi:MAG: LacI family DNA-binding transcriptional regulator [Anaerolineae bacterium]